MTLMVGKETQPKERQLLLVVAVAVEQITTTLAYAAEV
jgi:hypothetical protein